MPVNPNTTKMSDVITPAIEAKKANGHPLVLSDLDNCTVYPTIAPGGVDENAPEKYQAGSDQQYEWLVERNKKAFKGILSDEYATYLAEEEWGRAQKDCPVEPVDPDTPSLWKTAQDMDIPIAGLTARRPDDNEATEHQLRTVGIKLTKLYAIGDQKSKGDETIRILDNWDTEFPGREFPTHIYFPDDKPKHVNDVFESVKKWAAKHDREIVCETFHFTAANQRVHDYHQVMEKYTVPAAEKLLSEKKAIDGEIARLQAEDLEYQKQHQRVHKNTTTMSAVIEPAMVAKNAGGYPLVLSDLDNCTVYPTIALGGVDEDAPEKYQAGSDQQYEWLVERNKKAYKGIISDEYAIYLAEKEWGEAQKDCPVEPVDPNTPELWRKAQAAGIPIVGLTARRPDDNPATVNQLKTVGIELTKLHAIGDQASKGEQTVQILANWEREFPGRDFPTHIYFPDDKEKHVKDVFASVEKWAKDHGREIVCNTFHFTAANERVHAYHQAMEPHTERAAEKLRNGLTPLKILNLKAQDLEYQREQLHKQTEKLQTQLASGPPEAQPLMLQVEKLQKEIAPQKERANFKVQVHRGGRSHEGVAENSRRAFLKSYRDGADGIELDAQMVTPTPGGLDASRPMVFHGWADDLNKLTNVDDLLNSFLRGDPARINNLFNATNFLNDSAKVNYALTEGFLKDKTWISAFLNRNTPGVNLEAIPTNGADVNLKSILTPGNQLPDNFPHSLTDSQREALRNLYLEHRHPTVDFAPLLATANNAAPNNQIQLADLNPAQLNAIRSLYLVSRTGADLTHAGSLALGAGGVQLEGFDLSVKAQRQGLDALREMYFLENPDYLANVDPQPERILTDAAGIGAALTTPPAGMNINNINSVDLTRLVAIVNPPAPGVARDIEMFDMNHNELKALETLYFAQPAATRVEQPLAAGQGTNLKRLHDLKVTDPNEKGIIDMLRCYEGEILTLNLKAPNGDVTLDKIPYLDNVMQDIDQARAANPQDNGKFLINTEVKEASYPVCNNENHPTRPLEVHRDANGNAIKGKRDIAAAVSQTIDQAVTNAQAPTTKADNHIVSSFDVNVLGQMRNSDPEIPRSALISSFTARDFRINDDDLDHPMLEIREQQLSGQPDFTPGEWTTVRPALPQDRLYALTSPDVIDAIENHADILRNPNHAEYPRYRDIVAHRDDHEFVWNFTREELRDAIHGTATETGVLNHETTDMNGNAIQGIELGVDPAMISISAGNCDPDIAKDIHDIMRPNGQRTEIVLWTTNERSPNVLSTDEQKLQMETSDQLGVAGFITDHAEAVLKVKLNHQVDGIANDEIKHAVQAELERQKQQATSRIPADRERENLINQLKRERDNAIAQRNNVTLQRDQAIQERNTARTARQGREREHANLAEKIRNWGRTLGIAPVDTFFNRLIDPAHANDLNHALNGSPLQGQANPPPLPPPVIAAPHVTTTNATDPATLATINGLRAGNNNDYEINDITGIGTGRIPQGATALDFGAGVGERQKIILIDRDAVNNRDRLTILSTQQARVSNKLGMYRTDIQNRAHAPFVPARGQRPGLNNVPQDNPANDRNAARTALSNLAGDLKQVGKRSR